MYRKRRDSVDKVRDVGFGIVWYFEVRSCVRLESLESLVPQEVWKLVQVELCVKYLTFSAVCGDALC